jgi:hypothetical protein
MELVKSNRTKNRVVYRLANGVYRKYWFDKSFSWVCSHAELLSTLVPNYVIDRGENELGVWLDTNPIAGVPASTLPHTDEFIKEVYNFCLDSIIRTSPYVHGDWVLSNIIVDGNCMQLCDWDNVGIYPKEQVHNKLLADLESAFGNRFKEIINDSSSI